MTITGTSAGISYSQWQKDTAACSLSYSQISRLRSNHEKSWQIVPLPCSGTSNEHRDTSYIIRHPWAAEHGDTGALLHTPSGLMPSSGVCLQPSLGDDIQSWTDPHLGQSALLLTLTKHKLTHRDAAHCTEKFAKKKNKKRCTFCIWSLTSSGLYFHYKRRI